jgi:hypothetical protein
MMHICVQWLSIYTIILLKQEYAAVYQNTNGAYREYKSGSFCFVDDEVLFSLINQNDFELIHIKNDSDLADFFAIEYSFEKDARKLNEFVRTMQDSGKDYDEIIKCCIDAGVSRRKISETMNIDAKKLARIN